MPDFSHAFAGRFTEEEMRAAFKKVGLPVPDDERLYEVTVLHPVTYRVWAKDEDTAKRKAAILRPDIQNTEICVGFPESVAVKEIAVE